MTHLGDFEILLFRSQFLRSYWPNHATHRGTKRSKLSDILSFFLILTWIREEGFSPLPGCVLQSVFTVAQERFLNRGRRGRKH